MKKLPVYILVICVVIIGAYVADKFLIFEYGFKNLSPRVKAGSKSVKQYLPANSSFSPLFKMPSGYKIEVYADLGAAFPHQIIIDASGTLLVSIPDKGKVVALPDENGDGYFDKKIDVITGLNNPYGLAMEGNTLYVAESNKVVRYSYSTTDYLASMPEEIITLPNGGTNWARSLAIYDKKLYTSVGASCNVCESTEEYRSSILVSNLDGTDLQVMANGLRDTPAMAFDEQGQLWTAEIGRAGLGNSLPPDELNIITQGANYGWPYCYGERVRDTKFKKEKGIGYCSDTATPVFTFSAHSAPTGMAFIKSTNHFSPSDNGNLLVALQGSWRATGNTGYRIIKLVIIGDKVINSQDFISGWYQNGNVFGKPASLVFDQNGVLYISDSYSGLIYRVLRG